MASVTGRPSRALHIVIRIERSPPICAGGRHFVWTPNARSDHPLSRQREVIITNFRKVPLLPEAAVDKRYLIFGKFRSIVRSQVGDDRIGIHARVTDNVRHWRFLPTLIDCRVALLAGWRANVVR